MSDWSSDVCSSDLCEPPGPARRSAGARPSLPFPLAKSCCANAVCGRAGSWQVRHPPKPVLEVGRCRPLLPVRQAPAHDPRRKPRPIQPWQDVRASVGQSRSEEHTSELQSLMRISYAVFCLKKKTTKTCYLIL